MTKSACCNLDAFHWSKLTYVIFFFDDKRPGLVVIEIKITETSKKSNSTVNKNSKNSNYFSISDHISPFCGDTDTPVQNIQLNVSHNITFYWFLIWKNLEHLAILIHAHLSTLYGLLRIHHTCMVLGKKCLKSIFAEEAVPLHS